MTGQLLRPASTKGCVFGMQLVSAESTELFVGPPDAPLQLVRVTLAVTRRTRVRIDGDGLTGEAVAEPGDEVVEVPVTVERPVVGQRRPRAGARRRRRARSSNSPWPSPAGRCSWSATSTTTRSGGTPRAPTPASGAKTRRGAPGRPTASSWCTRIWRWPAASPSTSSCWPRWTTSSRTGTPTPRTAPTCAGSSPRAASK